MNFRTRVLVTFLPLALLPLMAFAWIVRSEISQRLNTQFERQAELLIHSVQQDLEVQSQGIAIALSRVRLAVADDNRFRAGIMTAEGDDRRFVIDYAARAMGLADLSVLQIQDSKGRILSSGHFRNEYDRIETVLPRLLSTLGTTAALAPVRTPEGSMVALLRVDSVRIGAGSFMILGGRAIGSQLLQRLTPADSVRVQIVHPGGIISSDRVDSTATRAARAQRSQTIPFIDAERNSISKALLVVSYGTEEIDSTRRSLDRWLLFAVLASLALIGIGVSILSARISRPLIELAEKTARVNLDRLNVDFRTRRRDEIGRLSQMLGKMTRKLRTSAAEIRDAERRATQGELARQVNHDIKNGLTPIRNVFAHLIDLAQNDPDELPSVLKDRSSTINSSISYLATLASNYARLGADTRSVPCDVSMIVATVVEDLATRDHIKIEAVTAADAWVLSDPVSIRRVLENLVDNAADSIAESGRIVVRTQLIVNDLNEHKVLLVVEDDGSGMTNDTKERVFDDFFTTKPDGTGLGLSIVRRLVMDAGGRIRVESEVGRGTTFTIELPGLKQNSANEH